MIGWASEQEWLHDLRTTETKQIRGQLINDLGFCCLGRLDAISDGDRGARPADRYPNDRDRPAWMAVHQSALCMDANDLVGMSFVEIADWWEAGRPVDCMGVPVRVARGDER